MADNVKLTEIHWLAGLLEGEGCFHATFRHGGNRTYRRVAISLVMTDEDSVQRAAQLLQTKCTKQAHRTKGDRPIFRAGLDGSKAIAWMMTLYPLMGLRRQAKIRECLGIWKAMPGRGSYQKLYPPKLEHGLDGRFLKVGGLSLTI